MKQTLKKLFIEIWTEREHVSEISGKPLLYPGNFKFHWQFAHVLGKQAYPRYKFRKENIMLMLPEEHEKQETFKIFRDKRDQLKEKYNRNE
jgi:hypothetical protein